MKKLLLLFILSFSRIIYAQEVNQCGILVPPKTAPVNSFLDIYEARDVIKSILESINWRSNFIIEERNGINNAYATILNNRRYVIYDNNFLTNLDRYAGTRWASISVLAHEMGHHYLNHVINQYGSTPAKELEADYFSGYVMAKLGASINEATAAIKAVSAIEASSTHPGRADRVAAITRGWNYEQGLTGPNATNMPAPQPQETPPPAASSAQWINLYLYGNHDMTVYLSDDGRTYNPASLKTSQPFVFKFEIYNYGFLRFANDPRQSTYKLVHGKNYAIVWNPKTSFWTVVGVQ